MVRLIIIRMIMLLASSMKKIPLSGKNGKGKFALVDNSVFTFLSKNRWYANTAGYPQRRQRKGEYGKLENRKTILMHHVVLPPKKGGVIDHINRNPFDCTLINLRQCTTQQNIFNRVKLGNKNGSRVTSKYKGVMLREYDRWEAAIKKDGKLFYLGYFKKEKQAARAYNTAALKLFGEFSLLNKV